MSSSSSPQADRDSSIAWNPNGLEPLEHVQTRDESPKSRGDAAQAFPDRRRSSDGSTASAGAGDTTDPTGNRGRRRSQRPSQASSGSQRRLTPLREHDDRRVLSPQSGNTLLGSDTGSCEPFFEPVVSTADVLTSFGDVAMRNAKRKETMGKLSEKEAKLQKIMRPFQQQNEIHRNTLEQLRAWVHYQHQDIWHLLKSTIIHPLRRPQMPSLKELEELACHYYPPRAELPCYVIDFKHGQTIPRKTHLGELEKYMSEKDDDIDVRWIHAPLGLGLMHSSVEDIFNYLGSKTAGRKFDQAGRSGWPFLEFEVFNFRSHRNFQEMRDVYLLLGDRNELRDDIGERTWCQLQDDLNLRTWQKDCNSSLRDDVDWRSNHLAWEPTFWNFNASDMPWQLSEGLTMAAQGPKEGLNPIGREAKRQALATHPIYASSHIVRNPFRFFHRSDGFLLTLSPMAGVNYLDKDFSKHLLEPIDSVIENEDVSAVKLCIEAFAQGGTRTWHRRTVEWLLVYLVTEIGITPHPVRQGFNAPTLEGSYSAVIQDLKRRRFEKWQPGITVLLVQEYLNCLEELTCILANLQKKVSLFKAVLLDVEQFESEDIADGSEPHNKEGESMVDRVNWALSAVEGQCGAFERLQTDLKQSLDALYQLRSIEQNDRAIISDNHNRAVLIFTGVTVVFLPLSFFTSYFGMNLAGIQNTSKTETYFWKVCGSTGLLIVLVITLYAYRQHIRDSIREYRRKHRKSQEEGYQDPAHVMKQHTQMV